MFGADIGSQLSRVAGGKYSFDVAAAAAAAAAVAATERTFLSWN